MDPKAEVNQTLQSYYEAFHHKDWNKFSDYLSDKFRYFTDKTIIMDKSKFVDFLKNDTWQGKEYRIYDINIHVAENGDMASAVYNTSFTGTDNNQELIVLAIETSLFVKEKGNWKIIHSHTSNKMSL